jgi:hypothetical protein
VASLTPLVEAGAVGPSRLAAYVQPLVLFLWPNILLTGAILFTVGVLARHAIPVYLAAAAFFIGYIAASNYWSSIHNPTLSVLVDPLGINGLLGMTRYWTPIERNQRLIGFPSMLLLNRLIWFTVAAGVFAVLHRRFQFAHAGDAGRRRTNRRSADAASTDQQSLVDVPRISGVFGLQTGIRQLLAVARECLVEVMSGRAFQVMFAVGIGLTMLWGWNVPETVFDTTTWPVTQLVVGKVLSERIGPLPWLIIALFAGELVWKEREVGTSEIADATPVPTSIALLGRFLALLTIVVVFHVAFMIAGLLIQTLQGYHNYELGLYVRALFGLRLIDHVLLAALAVTVHVLVNQKYIGHIVVLVACVFAMIAKPVGRFPYMAIYNSGPRWTYSDMNGFGPFLGSFLWFKLYWATWALLLGVVAALFWVRGRESGVRHRVAGARARLRGPTLRMAAVAAALVVMVGGFVFYNTNILNANPARDEIGRPQAEYERRYRTFEDLPQPVITAADLRVEIYPGKPAVEMRGRYRLVNRTQVPIDSIHVVVDTDVDTRSIAFDRTAKAVVADTKSGYRIFALEQPLRPGDSLALSFDVAFHPRGFRSSRIPTEVVANGTYFDRRWLPFIGYQPVLELTDGEARKRFGLETRALVPSADDRKARQYDDPVRNDDHVRVEAIIGTDGDQIALGSGILRRSWTENGRRYAHYATDVPVRFGTAVLSAKYAVREDKWNDIPLQIFYHPAHTYDVNRMAEGMKASLDYYTKTFGPYQFHQLRIAEIPPYSVNGRATATAILFAEQAFITRDREGQVDLTFFGTAHEVAHSWWAAQFRPAYARGEAFLSETMANYSAMMVTEKTLGPEQARRVYDYQMDRYLRRRGDFARDVPLLDVEDHPHIAYGKGAVAMYTLRDFLGDDMVNGALRRFLEKHRHDAPPYPTSRDLLAELRAVTPDTLQYLLTDLFETVTLWDVKTQRAVVDKTEAGEYRVTLDVVAKKMRADNVGHETETPLHDFVEIGVFASGKADVPLYLQRHRIHSGKQTISVIVQGEPSRAGIDPHNKLIDRDRGDNVVAVERRVN